MADNVALPGEGAVIATDDVGGVQYQVIKLAIGSDGSAQLVGAGNPLPVSVAGAATETTLAALLAALQPEDAPSSSGALGMPMLAMRYAADTVTTDNDGDWTVPKVDENGRLKVSTQPASYVDGSGNITASGQSVVLNVDRASNVTISMVATSLVGHAATFEYSNNSTNGTDGNWYGIQVVRSNANTVETTTGTLAATPAYGWEASVNAYKWVRVRATAHTSGTAAYLIKQGTYATEPIPAIQVTGTQPVSGSLTSAGATTNTPATPTPSNINSAATTNATSVKATAGTVYSIVATNTGAAAAYLKLYNKASAPTVGTDVPVLTIVLPAGGTVSAQFGALGHRFATGIALAITNGAADTDTAAVAASQVKVLTSYI